MRLSFLERSQGIRTGADSALILIYANNDRDVSILSEELCVFGPLTTKAKIHAACVG
jgi:hypothetical protein